MSDKNQKMTIENRVGRFFLVGVLAVWLLLIMAASSLNDDWRKALLGSACPLSWIIFGAALWASFRIRRRLFYVFMALALPPALFCGFKVYCMVKCGN